MASQNEIDRMKRLIDQQSKSGGTIGQQFFNNSGLSSNLAGMARAYAQRRGYSMGNAWRGGGGGRGGASDGLRNAVDARAGSGGALGDEWFNNSGLGAENRQAAMDYAASRGYTLGNAWADEKNPIFNSAGDQVRRTPYERNEAALAYRDQLKKQYGDNFYETFIPGLLEPGMQGYDSATGGGRWAYGQNGPGDPTGLRFSFRNIGFGSDTKLTPEQREQYSLQGLYGGYGAPAGFNAGQQQEGADPAGATAGGPNASSMKKFKSIKQGLRIMDRNMILNDKEARQIAKKTGKSYDDVIMAALKDKMTINSKAVKKSNERYNRRNPFGVSAYSTDPLKSMRNVRVGRGNVYGNPYKVDGVEQVNVAPRGGRNRRNPLTIQAPDAAAPTGTSDYGDFQDGFMGSIDTTPDVKLPGQQLGGGIGSKGATGITRTKSRIKKLGIGNYGSSLLGRNLQYGNFLNR